MQFPLIVYKNDNNDYIGLLPDFPGCYPMGETLDSLLDAVQNTVEAWMQGKKMDAFPFPTPLEQAETSSEAQRGVLMLADVDTAFLDNTAEQANITIPRRVLEIIDRKSRNLGVSRSAFLEKSVSSYISFEERYGPLPCPGTRCKVMCPPDVPSRCCSEPERLMCRDVISKVFPDEAFSEKYPPAYFKGQFPVYLDKSKRCFLDFAIETDEGKRIVVELDGYTYHAKNTNKENFNASLLRQNELALQGWTILRFSFEQLTKNPEQCREMLNEAAKMSPVVIEHFNKTALLTSPCKKDGCNGLAVRRVNPENNKFFWSCMICNGTSDVGSSFVSCQTCKKTSNNK